MFLPPVFYLISVKFRTKNLDTALKQAKENVRLQNTNWTEHHQKMRVLLQPRGFTNTPARK